MFVGCGFTGLWQKEKRKRFGASPWRMHPQLWNQKRKAGSRTFIKTWVHLSDFCCANGRTNRQFLMLSHNGCVFSVCSCILNTRTTWTASWGKILKWLVILNHERQTMRLNKSKIKGATFNVFMIKGQRSFDSNVLCLYDVTWCHICLVYCWHWLTSASQQLWKEIEIF